MPQGRLRERTMQISIHAGVDLAGATAKSAFPTSTSPRRLDASPTRDGSSHPIAELAGARQGAAFPLCTLIVLWRAHSSAPLVLACNRDEMLARPTDPMHLWETSPDASHATIVAGRDALDGGTWFAVGRRVVAALTNHRSGARSPKGARSRGELVARAAREPDTDAALALLLDRPASDYGPFHMLVADERRMTWVTNRDGSMRAEDVAPGVHVLGNYGLDDEHDAVVRTLHEETRGYPGLAEAELIARLQATLARSGPGWPCVHLGPYGTRSSAILLRGAGRRELRVAEGSPDATPWEDRRDLLERLDGLALGPEPRTERAPGVGS